jgi:hypothetical protein
MRMVLRLVLAGLLPALLGCATPGPTLRPEDFPSRNVEQPPVTVYWRLDRETAAVSATGLVDVDGLVDRLIQVIVELQGVDARGQVVSRGRAITEPRAFVGDRTWPFTARIRPTGQEADFVLHVTEVRWKIERAGGGM